ncbi:MAG TPA: LON peptidase substrate-binding domain-containing protein, partial [Immundisolibacter sp.]
MNANDPELTAPAASTVGDDVLLILPVRNLVLFPGVVMPLTVGRKGSVEAAQEAARSDRPLGLLLQKDASVDDPGPDDLDRVGTVASVLRFV